MLKYNIYLVILVLKGFYNHYFEIMYYKCINTHIINRNKTYTHSKGTKPHISSENWGLFSADGTGFKPEQRISRNTTYI